MTDAIAIEGSRHQAQVIGLGGQLALLGAYLVWATNREVTFFVVLFAVFGILAITLAIVGWLKPPRLVIGTRGFTVQPSIGAVKVVNWADIEVVRIDRAPMVLFDLRWITWDWRSGMTAIRRPLAFRSPAGVIGALPGQWNLPLNEVVGLMNAKLEASRR